MTDKNININVIISAILSLIFVFFSLGGLCFFEKFEAAIYDFGSGLARSQNINPDKIVLIEIDDKSIDKLGSWPWPRRIIAEMVDGLKENGARLIGLNIPVYEKEDNQGLDEIKKFREKYDAYPSGASDVSLKKWAIDNLDQIEKKIDNDSTLVNSIKNSGNVILPFYSSRPEGSEKDKTADESFLLKNGLNASGVSSSVKTAVSIGRMLPPVHEYAESAEGIGLVVEQSDDIYNRSYPAYINYKGTLIPSFPLRVAASYLGVAPEKLDVRGNSISLKGRIVSLSKGRMLIKFKEVKAHYSFADILNNKNLKRELKDKIILIGYSDYKSKTLDMPGVMTETQLNAQLVDNIINSGLISRPSIISWLEVILIFAAGIMAAFIFSVKKPIGKLIMIPGIFLLTLSAGPIMLITMGVWVKTVCIACCFLSVSLVLFLKGLYISETLGMESPEEARLLGINYQKKGLLDQAFKKYRRLPPDNESRELIYNLGLEYENNNKVSKAVEAYEFIASMGDYEDVEERIARLRKSERSSITGNLKGSDGADKMADSGERIRARVGRYEILSVLGKGSMGLVYKAQDPKINRLVAIKTIRFSDEFEEDLIQEIKERFFREAEIAGQLSHPSIVTIHDVGEDGDLTYMAMEFLEGEDLDKFITKGNLLSFRRVLDVIAKIADALDYAHKANVIHRDIKPANVMLLKNGNIKVTDFGIAKAISSSRTKTGVILGTPNYMSPEQIMGQKIDLRSDIFSVGVLFYQLITGELPFHGDNLSGLLYQITQIKHPSPRSYNPKIPGICEQILDKALAKDPNKRFRNAGEMARVINSLAQRIDQMRIEKSSMK